MGGESGGGEMTDEKKGIGGMNKDAFELLSEHLTAYINNGVTECLQNLKEYPSPYYNNEKDD